MRRRSSWWMPLPGEEGDEGGRELWPCSHACGVPAPPPPTPTQCACTLLCRWLEPRLPAVEELSFTLRCGEQHLGSSCMLSCEKLLKPSAAGPAAARPALRALSVEWPGPVLLDVGLGLGPTAGLTSLVYSCQLLHVMRWGIDLGYPNHHLLPPLQKFAFSDGSLDSGWPLQLPWLPPSLTLLSLDGASVRELPPLLAHLPALRRCAGALAPPCGRRGEAASSCRNLTLALLLRASL